MRIVKSVPKENIYFKSEETAKGNAKSDTELNVVNIFDDVKYQSVLGFGGAFTESSAYNYSLMDDDTKKAFLTAYFDEENGIGYNFGRTHINSCDFSLDLYSYIDEGDTELKTFSVDRDKKYILPFLKDCLAYTKQEMILFSSPWSPPAFMKENNSRIKGGKLLEKFYDTWAEFIVKFILAYKNEGINISAISVQNEPKAIQPWESCFYSAEDEKKFIKKSLIPALDRANLDTKIIIWDHNKERVYDRSRTIFSDEEVKNRVWAVGYHWYTGDHFEGLRLVHEQFNKPLICTEFCSTMEYDLLELAERYGTDMCENFNNFQTASCDWNLLLDELGGPYHNRISADISKEAELLDPKNGGCYAPILYDKTAKKMELTPIYYYIGHFSKFVKRGAVRIATTKFTSKINTCAFVNPNGEIVTVLINPQNEDTNVVLRHNDICTEVCLKAHSIATVID